VLGNSALIFSGLGDDSKSSSGLEVDWKPIETLSVIRSTLKISGITCEQINLKLIMFVSKIICQNRAVKNWPGLANSLPFQS